MNGLPPLLLAVLSATSPAAAQERLLHPCLMPHSDFDALEAAISADGWTELTQDGPRTLALQAAGEYWGRMQNPSPVLDDPEAANDALSAAHRYGVLVLNDEVTAYAQDGMTFALRRDDLNSPIYSCLVTARSIPEWDQHFEGARDWTDPNSENPIGISMTSNEASLQPGTTPVLVLFEMFAFTYAEPTVEPIYSPYALYVFSQLDQEG